MKVDYFNRPDFGKRYEKRRAGNLSGWSSEESYKEKEAVVERLLELYDVSKGGRFLELGCGAGNMTLFMANKGFEADGVDTAPEAVAWARERMEGLKANADFRIDNIVNLASYSDSFFDFVFDGDCLHCIIGSDRKTCLVNVFRVLKQGGLFYVQGNCMDETLKESLNISPDVYFDPQNQCLMRNGIPYYYLSREGELLGEIREAGFEIAHCEKVLKTTKHELFQAGELLVDAIKP